MTRRGFFRAAAFVAVALLMEDSDDEDGDLPT